MAQSVWNFSLFFSGPPSSQLFPKMSGGTLEWTLPVTPLLLVSAGDPLSRDSLLQSLSTNLLTFCWGVKIPSTSSPPLNHPAPSLCRAPQLLFLVDELLLLTNIGKKQVPMGILCPLVLSMWMHVPVDLAPQESPLRVEERKPAAQCIDWLIKWKTLLAVCVLSSMRSVY